MTTQFKQTLAELQDQLQFINLETDDIIEKSLKSVEITAAVLKTLRKQFLKNKYYGSDAEIDFFKNIKPKFTSLIIYHNTILAIETNIPRGGKKITKEYINKELKKLKRFFNNNLEFYNYHRTSSSYLDSKYFVRNNYDVKLRLDSFYFVTDHQFSTTHDYKVANILANDLTEVYLETKLADLNNKNHKTKSQPEPKRKITWTGTKVALVELIYAFQAKGVFNNGAAELQEIVTFFEEMLQIDLGQFRRTFLEIKERKTDRTKFLSALEQELEKRMNEND